MQQKSWFKFFICGFEYVELFDTPNYLETRFHKFLSFISNFWFQRPVSFVYLNTLSLIPQATNLTIRFSFTEDSQRKWVKELQNDAQIASLTWQCRKKAVIDDHSTVDLICNLIRKIAPQNVHILPGYWLDPVVRWAHMCTIMHAPTLRYMTCQVVGESGRGVGAVVSYTTSFLEPTRERGKVFYFRYFNCTIYLGLFVFRFYIFFKFGCYFWSLKSGRHRDFLWNHSEILVFSG